jgi:hypothetical protein
MSKEFFISTAVPIITFILGFITSRLTMSKKERKDHQARLQENSNKLSAELNNSFQVFTTALNKYSQKAGEPNLDDFFDISTCGESYFSQCRAICDSILSDNVDKKSVKNTHLPIMKEVIEKSLPMFYGALQEIAKKKSIQYSGTLKRENYKSIYEVYDKYKIGENK